MQGYEKIGDFENLKKRVQIANKRIRRIENVYGEKSWAIKQLYDKLDVEAIMGINKKGLIRVNKNMSKIQLNAIEKATTIFLSPSTKTSTLRGIKGVIKGVKKSLKATYGDIDRPMTDKEVNVLYDLVEDRNKRDTTEHIGASTIWNETVNAKDNNISLDRYIELIEGKSNVILNEEDKLFLEDIYKRYMNK